MDLNQILNNLKTWLLRSYSLVLVVVFAFALMVALSSYFVANIVSNQLEFSAKMELDSLQNRIETDLLEPKTVLGNHSENIRTMIMRGATKDEVHTYLREITRYNMTEQQLVDFVSFYGYFDVFGGALLTGHNRPVVEGYVATDRPWYKDAVSEGGKITFIDPYLWLMSATPEIVITYSRGIFDDNGKLLGVVGLNIDFGRIKKILINENKGKIWFGILLDKNFDFIFHVDSSLEGTNFANVTPDTARAVSELKKRHNLDKFKMINYEGVLSISFFRQLDNGWYVGIVTPEKTYFAEVRRVEYILIALGIVLSAIFSVIMLSIFEAKHKSELEKHKAEVMLKEADEMIANVGIMDKILNSLDAMIYITNPKTGEILFINNNAKESYKVDDDCIGMLCHQVFNKGSENKCEFCPCNKLDQNPGQNIEWFDYNAETKRHHRNTSCYIKWTGDIIAHMRYSVDITELYDAKEQAVSANRVKSDFLARMSHEIRSPMNAILGIIEIELEKQLPPDTEEALDRVHNSGYMLLNIINDILDLSKIESGKMELSPVNYDVSSVINDTVQLNLMRFGSKPIKFSLVVDENTPSTLFGDDLRIKQVLNNLLSNSFKYTDSGEISLSVSVEKTIPGNPVMLIICVKDTGKGMTKDQIESLFEDYARFNSEANRQIEGTGLGMPITKSFIDMMKGEMKVESEPGKGSTFTLRVPQGYVDSNVLGKEGASSLQQFNVEKLARQKRAPMIQREYMPYGKILVVDDMEPNLFVAKGLMAPYGLSIDTVSSGKEAIEKVKAGQVFDIIFMDHYMPEMDGMEATKIIRSLGYKHTIIALTANALVGQAEMYLANGFDGFMSKPIDTRQINSTLNRFIRDKYPPETIAAARELKKKLEGAGDNANAPPDLSKMKALVVDDFMPNLLVAQGMLQEYKMQADGLTSGQEAVERIKKGEPKYDIIFMDLMMPEMEGLEATKLIRSIGTEYADTVPIIALTAIITNDTAKQEKMLLDNGFQAVLYKPLSVVKVDLFLKDWIKNRAKVAISPNQEEENMTIDIPGVEEGRVMELYGGSMKIFLPVLRSYLSVIPASLEEISRVTADKLADYTVKVHGIKSTSDSIGAEEARKMALELEMAGKAGDMATISAKNETLIKYVKELLVNIEKWLAKQDGK